MDPDIRLRLGKLRSRHRTVNPNNPWVLWGIAVMGAVGVVAVVVWWEEFDAGPLRGVPFGALLAGAIGGTLSLRQRDERFVLYEHGLVHLRGRESRVVFWADVTRVRNWRESNPGGGIRGVRRRLGYDVWCRVKVRGGPSLLITAFTEQADRLADAVEYACDREVERRKAEGRVVEGVSAARSGSWQVRTRGGMLLLIGLFWITVGTGLISEVPGEHAAERALGEAAVCASEREMADEDCRWVVPAVVRDVRSGWDSWVELDGAGPAHGRVSMAGDEALDRLAPGDRVIASVWRGEVVAVSVHGDETRFAAEADPVGSAVVSVLVGLAMLVPGVWCAGRGLRRLLPWREPRPGAGQGWTRNAWSALLLAVWALVLAAVAAGDGAGLGGTAALWGVGAVLLAALGLRASWRDGDLHYWRAVARTWQGVRFEQR